MSDPDRWRERAACRQSRNPDQFFSLRVSAQQSALALCEECPVIEACRAYAVDADLAGVWGGTTHLQRLLDAAVTRTCSAGHELTVETAFVRQKGASYRLGCLVCNRAAQARYKRRVRAAKEVSA